MNSESTCRKTLKAVYIKKITLPFISKSCSVAADYSKSREKRKTLIITTHINGVRQMKGILGILSCFKKISSMCFNWSEEAPQMMTSTNSSWQNILIL